MFEKGEYIIYGSNGVCEVQDYMNAAGETDNRTYYVLAPMRSKGSTIFSPVDNQKVLMRKLRRVVIIDEFRGLSITVTSK